MRIRRRALASLTTASCVGFAAACSSPPATGIHVTLALTEDPRWSSAFVDHVSIIAEGADGTRGVACLFSLSSTPPVEVVEVLGDDPCADVRTSPAVLTPLGPAASLADDWNLASRKGVNVLARNGESLHVRAIASLGGAALLGRSLSYRAEGTLAASGAFPTLALVLAPNAHELVDDCPGLDPLPEGMGSGGASPNAPVDSCPRRAGASARHASVVVRQDGSLRVPPSLAPSCGESDPVVAWKTAPIALPPRSQGQCVQITIEARFASCTAGSSGNDCALTVRCTPPATRFVLLAADGTFLPTTDQDIGCLPSTNASLTFRTEFAPVSVERVSAAIEQVGAAGPDACFLDIRRIDTTLVACGK